MIRTVKNHTDMCWWLVNTGDYQERHVPRQSSPPGWPFRAGCPALPSRRPALAGLRPLQTLSDHTGASLSFYCQTRTARPIGVTLLPFSWDNGRKALSYQGTSSRFTPTSMLNDWAPATYFQTGEGEHFTQRREGPFHGGGTVWANPGCCAMLVLFWAVTGKTAAGRWRAGGPPLHWGSCWPFPGRGEGPVMLTLVSTP